jgi:antitoxin component of RelBE/YafQ-DinJ toxin-antitoxin module
MMKTIGFVATDADFQKAEQVLSSMGMSLSIAVGIFVTLIARDERLPFRLGEPTEKTLPDTTLAPIDVASGDYSHDVDKGQTIQDPRGSDSDSISRGAQNKRKLKKITPEMVREVWDVFMDADEDERKNKNKLKEEIADSSGMDPGSAYIYLVVLDHLFRGREIKRGIQLADIQFFLSQIKADRSLSQSVKNAAIRSLKKSIPYWEVKMGRTYADKIEKLISD